jgi:hypothetical protein
VRSGRVRTATVARFGETVVDLVAERASVVE